MTKDAPILDPMTAADIDHAVDLIARAMNPAEAEWARKTMGYHLACTGQGIEDGRAYYVWRPEGRIAGIVGLHQYLWGPPENVWLAWFAVDPDRQGQGHGRALLEAMEAVAARRGYRKFFVETYAHEDFAKARQFYTRQGFEEAGRIAHYLEDGSDMVVYRKEIGSRE